MSKGLLYIITTTTTTTNQAKGLLQTKRSLPDGIFWKWEKASHRDVAVWGLLLVL